MFSAPNGDKQKLHKSTVHKFCGSVNLCERSIQKFAMKGSRNRASCDRECQSTGAVQEDYGHAE